VTTPRSAPIYHEPARSYTTVIVLLAVFVVGCVTDWAVTGRAGHVLGWVVAAVVVCGILLVATRAVRTFRSITVTDDAVTVGTHALDRASIVGCDRAVDPALPVLGQTMREGLPKGVPGLTLRLADGGVIAVPTRRPAALAAVLELPEPLSDIRPAEPGDSLALQDIERRTATLYRVAGVELPAGWTNLKQIDEAAAVFVVGRPAEGFARLGEIDGLAHLAVIAVIPPRIRTGLGARLLDAACVWARARGFPAIVVTTFADLTWNAPFFAAHGFVEVDGLSPGLAELRDWERAAGLDGVARRVVMRREL
jgi:GNAT superfamily N-acetyltransferase